MFFTSKIKEFVKFTSWLERSFHTRSSVLAGGRENAGERDNRLRALRAARPHAVGYVGVCGQEKGVIKCPLQGYLAHKKISLVLSLFLSLSLSLYLSLFLFHSLSHTHSLSLSPSRSRRSTRKCSRERQRLNSPFALHASIQWAMVGHVGM